MLSSQIQEYQKMQATLMGIAYRLLGSWSEAEDAVQDVFVTWYEQADHSKIANSQAWLAKVCTNRCLDKLKSAHHKRMNYIGLWLPEPLQTEVTDAPEDLIDQRKSLEYAFLTVLDRLGPNERAAYLLREVFDYGYDEVAEFLGISLVNSRQIVSRARKNIQSTYKPSVEDGALQRALLAAFKQAVSTGDTRHFAAKLSHAVELWADGGGKVVAAQEAVQGIDAIAHLIKEGLFHAWKAFNLIEAQINCAPGLILMFENKAVGCVTCEIDSGQGGTRIFVVRNPDKLRQLNSTAKIGVLDDQSVAGLADLSAPETGFLDVEQNLGRSDFPVLSTRYCRFCPGSWTSSNPQPTAQADPELVLAPYHVGSESIRPWAALADKLF